MSKIKESINDIRLKSAADSNAYKYYSLYADLQDLLKDLLENYVIISKDSIKERVCTDVIKQSPLTTPEIKTMTTIFSVTAKTDYVEHEVVDSFIKYRQLDYIFWELEK